MNIPPLILVVDDEIGARTLIKIMLQRGGYEVITENDAIDGLQALRAYSPDLIITDNMMPGKCGSDLAREVRRDPAFAEIPILLMTSRGAANEIADALDAGVDQVLLKPLHHHDMLMSVQQILETKHCEPFPRGCALLVHGIYPDGEYLSQLCAAVSARIGAPAIALPSRRDGGGRNWNLVEALRMSKSLTVCATSEMLERDYVRFAYEYFAGHDKPMAAILFDETELPDVFNTCHVYTPHELEPLCQWLARIHRRQ